MKKVILVGLLLTVAAITEAAEPYSTTTPNPYIVPIVRSESSKTEDGSYDFLYENGDGTYRQETGTVVNPHTEDAAVKVTGSYKYIDDEGKEVTVDYTADENGFIPYGPTIPKEITEAAIAYRDAAIRERQQNNRPQH